MRQFSFIMAILVLTGYGCADNEDEDIVEKPKAENKEQMIARGKTVYTRNCQSCHQANGQGIPNAFPPVAGSDYLNEDAERSIDIVMNGMEGQIKVSGEVFNSVMPKLNLSDEDIAYVLTYVYNNWNNNGSTVTPEQVAAHRK